MTQPTETLTLPVRRPAVGRPSKFTPDTRARLVQLIAKGCPFKHACRAVRISFVSFSNYREQHPDFAEEIEQAVAAAIEKRLDVIQKAADAGDVNSAKWLLEHLHPESFARNRVEISGPDGSPLAAAIAVYLPKKDGDDGTLPAVTVTATAKEVENGSEAR